MGDVADILGGQRRPQVSEGDALLMDGKTAPPGGGAAGATKGKRKPAGMSREVFNLIGKDGMAPMVVSKKPTGLKDKRDGAARTRWVWTNFSNSGRKDQADVFYHWVKAATDYPDYPFARFNVSTPAVEFTEEEYQAHLTDPAWTKEETEELLALCQKYDLRWPVIFDRYPQPGTEGGAGGEGKEEEKKQEGGGAAATAATTTTSKKHRSIEDLQARYYTLFKALHFAKKAKGIPVPVNPRLEEGAGETFNHPYERKRRKQLELLFKRSKEDELEELRLREELKTIDAALKRVKKHPVKSSVREPAEAKAATITENTPQGPRTMPLVNEKLIQETRPEPKPGHPYLQSARLTVPAAAPRLQKGMLAKVKQMLVDLGLPPRPLPTKTVCDLYDDLRRDMVELFTLTKLTRQKEQQLEGLKRGEDPAAVFARHTLGTGGGEGVVGIGGGGGIRGLAPGQGGGGGGGGGQRKGHHKRATSGAAGQGGRQYVPGQGGGGGGGGMVHAGSDSSLSAGDERKRKRV